MFDQENTEVKRHDEEAISKEGGDLVILYMVVGLSGSEPRPSLPRSSI